MKFLVCANTIFDFFNGKTELFHFFDELENIYISTISIGEIIFQSSQIKNKLNIQEIATDFYQLLHVINIDETVSKKYAELKNKYPSFPDNELWICASSIVNDCVIVTNNSDFDSISEVILKHY